MRHYMRESVEHPYAGLNGRKES